jgi:hypothetical protein
MLSTKQIKSRQLAFLSLSIMNPRIKLNKGCKFMTTAHVVSEKWLILPKVAIFATKSLKILKERPTPCP